MLKTIKSLSMLMLLGLGMITGHTVAAMDRPAQDTTSGPSLPTLYWSNKAEINDLLAKDSLKNFVYQAKRHAKNPLQTLTPSHEDYKRDAKILWQKIRTADTSIPEVKDLIYDFAITHNKHFYPEMQQWINKQDFIIREQELNHLLGELLPFFIMDMSGILDKNSKMGQIAIKKRDRFDELMCEKFGIEKGNKDKLNQVINEKMRTQ